MIENKKLKKDSGKIMIKALKLSKIKAFKPFLKVHQKFRPYSIICAMHIRASEDALSVHEQVLRFERIKHEKKLAAEKRVIT